MLMIIIEQRIFAMLAKNKLTLYLLITLIVFGTSLTPLKANEKITLRCQGDFNNYLTNTGKMPLTDVFVSLSEDWIEIGYLPFFSGKHRIQSKTDIGIFFSLSNAKNSQGRLNRHTGFLWITAEHPNDSSRLSALFDGICKVSKPIF